MWKLVNGRLIQTVDESRAELVTNISESILESLREIAKENNTHPNYLIESGLMKVLTDDFISYDKKSRPKDRIPHNTTYDEELLSEVREFAKKNRLFLNDVIEYSVQFIDIENAKKANHRYRIEKESLSNVGN